MGSNFPSEYMYIIILQLQWYVTKIPGCFDMNAQTTASYKPQHFDIDCGFEFTWVCKIYSIEELLFLYSKHITKNVLLL